MAEQAEAPQGLAACSTFYFTLILIFFDLEPDFTVMVAVPFFFAVITPIEVEAWWTNLGDPDEEIISLYHAHGECEQFHSEVKTDMDLERLPSGKFATNALILELGMIAYNILRMIGQGTIGGRAPRQKRDVKRRRLRTVISNLIMMAGHITMHARQLITGLGRSNIWRHIFSDICQKYAVTNS